MKNKDVRSLKEETGRREKRRERTEKTEDQTRLKRRRIQEREELDVRDLSEKEAIKSITMSLLRQTQREKQGGRDLSLIHI